MEKNYIVLEGKTNDLLIINGDDTLKSTRLIKLDKNTTDVLKEEIIDISITSTNMNKQHKTFDKLLGKNIRISVDILD